MRPPSFIGGSRRPWMRPQNPQFLGTLPKLSSTKCGILSKKKSKNLDHQSLGSWQWENHCSGLTGGRDAATFRRLYNKVKHLKQALFYTDDWDAFSAVLPKNRHVVGKSGTVSIERDNSNTRHHLARFTRRTKVVSKKESMVYDSIKLWCALTNQDFFKKVQERFLCIFR